MIALYTQYRPDRVIRGYTRTTQSEIRLRQDAKTSAAHKLVQFQGWNSREIPNEDGRDPTICWHTLHPD